MKRQKFEVRRTPEGTAFEIAFLALAVLVWAGVVVLLNHAPDVVPTHFGPTGRPDAYGGKLQMLFPCIVTTVVGLCCLAGAYFPHTVNLPVRMTNVRQAALATRLMRVLAIGMLLLTAAIAYSTVVGSAVPALGVVAVVVAVCLLFTVLIYKAK